jgi:signal transduction histidine kinase
MKKIFFILLSVMLLLSTVNVFSQANKIDSLLLLLKISKPDTGKINKLIALAEEFKNKNPDTAICFAAEAMAFATKLNYKMGIADSKLARARAIANLGKTEEGLVHCNDALKIYAQLSLLKTVDQSKVLQQRSNAYNIKGIIYIMQGNYPEALKYLFSSLLLCEKNGDKKGIAYIENNIGTVYFYQRKFPECLKHYYISLKIRNEFGDKQGCAGSYNNIGLAYMEQGDFGQALQSYGVSLKLAEELGDKGTMANVYSNTGFIETKQGKYDDAVNHLHLAISILKETGNKDGLIAAYTNIGQTYTKQKKYTEASKYLHQALTYAKEMSALLRMQEIYSELTILDSSQGNFKPALQHYKLSIYCRDSMFNSRNTTKLMQTQLQFEFDKKEFLAKAEQDRKDLLTAAEINRQKMSRNYSLAGIGVVLVFSCYGFYRYKKRKRLQNQQALMDERLRISRELHDEVGATLSGISMYSHLAIDQIKSFAKLEVVKSLNIIQQSSAEMVNKLNDIVWLINPDQGSLQKLIDRLQEYAIDMAAIKNMRVTVTVPEKIADSNLPIENRRNVFLFCKEAINNAIKYSQGSLLELSIKKVGSTLHFTVSDNGKGFDAATVRKGNGLENMQKRADEIGAKFILESGQDEGATISLQCKST